MSKKNIGFSLVELIVVIAILAIMVAMFTGAINPIAQMNRANDTKRKKDLARIKVSFEEYYNDNGCYPQEELPDLMNTNNCDGGIFRPWLNSWPCDPTRRTPYRIEVESSTCPDWFKVYTNLENRNDIDIPADWYEEGIKMEMGPSMTVNDANYGVSSTNVTWYEDVSCAGQCVVWISSINCDSQEEGCDDCYIGNCHLDRCYCSHCEFGVCYD